MKNERSSGDQAATVFGSILVPVGTHPNVFAVDSIPRTSSSAETSSETSSESEVNKVNTRVWHFPSLNPHKTMVKLRIATLQLNPKINAVADNIQRANTILSQAFPAHKKPDLLILPELALTGYNFSSRSHITPFLESPSAPGPSLKWAEETSRKHGCFTVLGYPESHGDTIYNSAAVFNKQGQIIHNYRKSFLYETDEVWGAVEGSGFKAFELMDGVRASVGICMDLNPYKFEAPFNAFEFSGHCLEEGVNLILCPMAWLHAESPSIKDVYTKEQKTELKEEYKKRSAAIDGKFTIDGNQEISIDDFEILEQYEQLEQPDFKNLNYWLLRFFPFMNHQLKLEKFKKKATLVLCNRSGIEDEVLYGGTSSIVQFNGKSGLFGFNGFDLTNGSVDVLGALGKGNEGILIRDVDI